MVQITFHVTLIDCDPVGMTLTCVGGPEGAKTE